MKKGKKIIVAILLVIVVMTNLSGWQLGIYGYIVQCDYSNY